MSLTNYRQHGSGGGGAQGKTPVLVGLGANLPSRFGPPRETLLVALDRLAAHGVKTIRLSRFWRSPPWPPSDQPWYVNAVAEIGTSLSPEALLAALHAVEAEFGRVRGLANAARPIDLDLLAFGIEIRHGPGLILPHPRMAERAFVLLPLAEIAELWCHPLTGEELSALIAALPEDHGAEPLGDR